MGAPWRMQGSVETYIEAPPADVYACLADVTRTGERSPECRAADWLPGHPPGTVGARFRGRNRVGRLIRWSRVCEIVAADEPRVFTFRTIPERIDLSRRDSTTWSYRVEPQGSGTRVTHSYEVTQWPLALFKVLYGRLLPHHRDMRPQMAETLEKLRNSLESAPSDTVR